MTRTTKTVYISNQRLRQQIDSLTARVKELEIGVDNYKIACDVETRKRIDAESKITELEAERDTTLAHLADAQKYGRELESKNEWLQGRAKNADHCCDMAHQRTSELFKRVTELKTERDALRAVVGAARECRCLSYQRECDCRLSEALDNLQDLQAIAATKTPATERPPEGCSCHISPPCSWCVYYSPCPDCGDERSDCVCGTYGGDVATQHKGER